MSRVIAGLLFVFTAITVTAAASGEFDRISEMGVRELRVESSLLDVEVTGGSSAVVEGWGENIPDNVEVKFERRGSVLHVRVKQRFSLFTFSRAGKLFFRVPSGIDLDIRSASGSVDIRRMSAPSLVFESSSGRLTIEGVDGDINVKSSSGEMEMKTTSGSLRARTSSGGITGQDVWITGDSTFYSSSGRIDIDFDNA